MLHKHIIITIIEIIAKMNSLCDKEISDALYDALESGKLSGAAVDVTDPEPLPAEHPLWQQENAVITPHVSGGFHLPETHDRIIRIMAENLSAFGKGEPLRNVVDFETGYRKL